MRGGRKDSTTRLLPVSISDSELQTNRYAGRVMDTGEVWNPSILFNQKDLLVVKRSAGRVISRPTYLFD